MVNMTFMDTGSTMVDLLNGVNTASSGVFGALVLLAVAIVFFVAMKRHDTKVVMLVTSFALSILSIFMFMFGFIGIEIMMICFVWFIISLFIKLVME